MSRTVEPPREDSASSLSSIHKHASLVGRGQPGRTVLPSLPHLVGLVAILLAGGAPVLGAAEPFFKPNDVVALVGGGDMALMRDHPGIELLVRQQRGLSGVRFRILAQEGDTVFEQFRDLNFPSWEEQLGKVGATVVITQFGRMESLAGAERLPEFIAAYEAAIEPIRGRGRRLVIMSPMALGPPPSGAGAPTDSEARPASKRSMAMQPRRENWPAGAAGASSISPGETRRLFSCRWQPLAEVILPRAITTDGFRDSWPEHLGSRGLCRRQFTSPSCRCVKQKNTLWFHYWRPQNWAFLAGDRTEQPSSRDHRDPTKRWFPAEMETWLPLVEAKEKEIQTMIESSRKP